jgi:hypothetical protein
MAGGAILMEQPAWGKRLPSEVIAIMGLRPVFARIIAAFRSRAIAGGKLLIKGAVKLLAQEAANEGPGSSKRVFSSKRSSEGQRIAEAPTTITRLRQSLGRAGLLDSNKVALVRASPEEVPKLPDATLFGWITEQGGRLVTDRRGRVIIKLTDHALASLRTAVETVGHELHHVGEMRAGSGASEQAAENAAKAYWARFLQRLNRLE